MVLSFLMIGASPLFPNISLTDDQKDLLEAFKRDGRVTTYKVSMLDPEGEKYGSGTGFVLRYHDKLYFITNSHVCQPNGDDVVEIDGSEKLIAGRHRDPDADLCVAKINHLLSPPSLSLSESLLQKGDTVYTVGFPHGSYEGAAWQFLSYEKTSWIGGFKIDHKDPNDCQTESGFGEKATEKYCVINTDMAFVLGHSEPGASGSPVLNEEGDVVGVFAGTVGFNPVFVPAYKLKEFLDRTFP